MFALGVLIFIFAAFVAMEFLSLKRFFSKGVRTRKSLQHTQESLHSQESSLKQKAEVLEVKVADIFFFYDLTRKLAPILNKTKLLTVFFEEIKYHSGQIEKVEFSRPPEREDYLEFSFGEGEPETVYLKTKSTRIVEYLPHFSKLLSLCQERINLYEKLQQLSLHDSLTEIYNRRYVMERFFGEFERAKKFNLNLSVLTVDVDHFKTINDTYGHLVGDSVLKEVARMIKENIREIDFVARVGGEEFSVVLPETDKAGAIMVGERIIERVSNEKIKAFDEILSVTTSVGVASYPQNSLYPDVLIEISDKALYKAKISGRNRVCWF
ncbi:MAG: GGDEF domain-containing protein [Candidatus Omnitrophota bacterium]|nr:MAG: GGDEF domain-containing protein [Candidatus Omnitrophota bacterium]